MHGQSDVAVTEDVALLVDARGRPGGKSVEKRRDGPVNAEGGRVTTRAALDSDRWAGDPRLSRQGPTVVVTWA